MKEGYEGRKTMKDVRKEGRKEERKVMKEGHERA
jgi:hypothetical protein